MTLCTLVAQSSAPFSQALQAFIDGQPDPATLRLLSSGDTTSGTPADSTLAGGASRGAAAGRTAAAGSACTVTATCSDSTRRCDAALIGVSIGTTRSGLRLGGARSRDRKSVV